MGCCFTKDEYVHFAYGISQLLWEKFLFFWAIKQYCVGIFNEGLMKRCGAAWIGQHAICNNGWTRPAPPAYWWWHTSVHLIPVSSVLNAFYWAATTMKLQVESLFLAFMLSTCRSDYIWMLFPKAIFITTMRGTWQVQFGLKYAWTRDTCSRPSRIFYSYVKISAIYDSFMKQCCLHPDPLTPFYTPVCNRLHTICRAKLVCVCGGGGDLALVRFYCILLHF